MKTHLRFWTESVVRVAAASGVAVASLVACSAESEPASTHQVSLLQSSRQEASELTLADVTDLVVSAVSQAGGLDFIVDGQTVVLKPNLVTFYEDGGSHTAAATVNGVATDWRVVKAVADMVRARNPNGQVLVMEGSHVLTQAVYPVLGYTADNFGTSVDEFLGIEGSSCSEPNALDLEERVAPSGMRYWVNTRYMNADIIIALPTLATDAAAGVGGAVKSLGIGGTPAPKYGSGTNSVDCTRTGIDQSSPQVVGDFIVEYYGLRPADFVVMDGLQGLQHGPLPAWDDSGSYDYDASLMNMRLILAGANAVAVDTIAALVMGCVPDNVPFLSDLHAAGLGTTDAKEIDVVGQTLSAVTKPFAGQQTAICPGN